MKTSDFFEANIRTFEAKPRNFCSKKSDVSCLPNSKGQSRKHRAVFSFSKTCFMPVPVPAGPGTCLTSPDNRSTLKRQSAGTSRCGRSGGLPYMCSVPCCPCFFRQQTTLPRKLELEVDAEILRACGVGRGCEERAVHLTVVVQREGEILGDGIVGCETCLYHLVAACGL